MIDDEANKLVTLAEIAKAIGKHKSSISRQANKEGWKYIEKPAAGKPLRLYDPKDLPQDIRFLLILKKDTNRAKALRKPLFEISRYRLMPDFGKGYWDGWNNFTEWQPVGQPLDSDGYCMGFGLGSWAASAEWSGWEAYRANDFSCPYRKRDELGSYLREYWVKGYREAMDYHMERAA